MRLLVVGDTQGVEQLLSHISREHVVALCAASIRPQYITGMKQLARSLDVPLLIQPRRTESEFTCFAEGMEALAVDLVLVNSYSMLIPEEFLQLSRLGGINVHASLLPRNRGPNPIQWAMIRGEQSSGVSIHEMTRGFDEGPIIAQREVPIFFEDTWHTVKVRLNRATEELLRENLDSVCSGSWLSTPQDEAIATKNRRRGTSDSRFDWTDRLIDIYRLHRAVLPPMPPAWSIGQSGATVKLTNPLTPMGLLNLLWAERQDPLLARGGGITDSDGTDWQKVNLRPIRQEDSALLQKWTSDRELAVLNSPYWPLLDIDHEAWIESVMVRRSDLVIFIIEDETRNPIGICQLVNINWRHQSAEIQIWIAPRAQGRGLGTSAIEKLCSFGFSDLGLHRISLNVWTTNQRAIRAHEKAGFQWEGRLTEAAFVDGHFEDVLIMGRVRQ